MPVGWSYKTINLQTMARDAEESKFLAFCIASIVIKDHLENAM